MMRAFELASALLGLFLLSPLFLLAALAIKMESHGPIFYRAKRVGQKGQIFYPYKFRTMIENAIYLGPGITTAGDQRITRVGRFLRRTKIDELPQLINVITGEMGLVGPRPEDPRYVALYTIEQRRVLTVPPGITSLASLRYRNEEQLLHGPEWEQTYIDRIMVDKLNLELAYLQRRSFRSDLGVIMQTLLVMFRSYSITDLAIYADRLDKARRTRNPG